MQFQCQEDFPPGLDLLHRSTPMVRGVFPRLRYFVLVLLEGGMRMAGAVDVEAAEGRAGVRIVFQFRNDF